MRKGNEQCLRRRPTHHPQTYYNQVKKLHFITLDRSILDLRSYWASTVPRISHICQPWEAREFFSDWSEASSRLPLDQHLLTSGTSGRVDDGDLLVLSGSASILGFDWSEIYQQDPPATPRHSCYVRVFRFRPSLWLWVAIGRPSAAIGRRRPHTLVLGCVAISVLPPAPFAFVLLRLVLLSPGIGHSCSHAHWRGSLAARAVRSCPLGGIASPPDSAPAVLGLACPLVQCHDAVATVKYVFAFYWLSLSPLLGRPSTPIGRCVSRGVRMVHGVSGERRVGLQPGGSQAVTHRFSHVLIHGPRCVHAANSCLDSLVLLPFRGRLLSRCQRCISGHCLCSQASSGCAAISYVGHSRQGRRQPGRSPCA